MPGTGGKGNEESLLTGAEFLLDGKVLETDAGDGGTAIKYTYNSDLHTLE